MEERNALSTVSKTLNNIVCCTTPENGKVKKNKKIKIKNKKIKIKIKNKNKK